MKELDAQVPSGWTTFCDDIRFENNGKRLFIGVYSGTMFVSAPFPITLPSLAFNVAYIDESGVELPPLSLKIFFPGDEEDSPSIVSEFPQGFHSEKQRASVDRPFEQPGDQLLMIMNIPLVVYGVEIKQPGAIKVRMHRGDEIIKMGRLNVMHHPEYVPPAPEGTNEEDIPTSGGAMLT